MKSPPLILASFALTAGCNGSDEVGRYVMSGDKMIDTATGCVVEISMGISGSPHVAAFNPFNPDDKSCSALSTPPPADNRSPAEKQAAEKEVQDAIDMLSGGSDGDKK